jgi:hypothetical protein
MSNLYSNAPNTLAVGNAIVSFAQALAYPGTSTLVYTTVTLGEQKDVTNNVAGGNVSLEVYANTDDSQHKGFGGKIKDTQSWYLLSLVSLDNAQTAEQTICNVRDALMVPFQTHATLGGAGSVYHSQLRPNSSRFFRVFRNQQWLRAYVCEILILQEWFVITPPGVVS